MIEKTISPDAARRFYDRLGKDHDWAERYEGRAKKLALSKLDLSYGQQVLNVGVGTGRAQTLIEQAIAPGGIGVGLDLSPVMLRLTQQRTNALLCDGRDGDFF